MVLLMALKNSYIYIVYTDVCRIIGHQRFVQDAFHAILLVLLELLLENIIFLKC